MANMAMYFMINSCQKQGSIRLFTDNVNSRSISSFVRWPIIFILWTFLTEYFFLLLRLVRYNIEIFMILFYVSGRSITRQTKESKLRPTLPFLFQLNNKYQLDLQSKGSSLYLTLHRLCPRDATGCPSHFGLTETFINPP